MASSLTKNVMDRSLSSIKKSVRISPMRSMASRSEILNPFWAPPWFFLGQYNFRWAFSRFSFIGNVNAKTWWGSTDSCLITARFCWPLMSASNMSRVPLKAAKFLVSGNLASVSGVSRYAFSIKRMGFKSRSMICCIRG